MSPSKRSIAPSASFWESARIALDSLNKSKLRSFLTLLGIILATSTLIAVMSFVHGMNLYIATKLSDMGSNGFRVVRIAFIGNWDPKKFLEMQRRNPQIKPEEYDFIRSHAQLLSDIGLETFKNVTVAYAGQTMQSVGLQGITATIPDLSDIEVGTGRMLTEEEIRRHAPFAFIGTDVSEKFFSGKDPIGKTIKADGVPYEVVGVAKAKGSVFGQSQDNFVMIPVYSYFKTYGNNLHNDIAIFARAADPNHMQEAENEVRMLLRTYRHLRPNEEDTFSMFGSDTLSKAWDNLTGAIAGMAFGVVSVFLVVGGIVIMNIMLAVVTERTQEIGIRKAVGARQQDILNQFLVESSVLAVIGGLIGVIISYLLTVIVRKTTPLPMDLPIVGVALGVGLSLIVGLFFGIYPARQAAKLDPIVALHAE
ncbi:MAG: ABC transporter permease [Acidobacteriaceae bacterium]|nr:ABC transporter permease [Acidobacteriaceae bacterium]MBV9037858.1 ABC transporter permease [Acidobacteriaceae bacterium]MBV9226268.1 ABC transporter permease [Acidobacteriaceae bacterium]MBV9674861.1 ABC transporter permease [Acidobacteriaceae bacterium]